MEEEKDLYYRLFIPLSNKQKEDVFDIWMDNIEEDIYLRIEAISNYCIKRKIENNNSDFMMALYSIIQKINNKYFCKYYEYDQNSVPIYEYHYYDEDDLVNFVKKRIIAKLNHSGENNKIHIENLITIIKSNHFYNYLNAYEEEFYDYDYTHIQSISNDKVIEDTKILEKHINNIIKKRRNDPILFNEKIFEFESIIKNYDSLPEIEKQMYYKKPNSKESYNLYLQNEERKLLNPTTLKHILKLCSKITDLSSEYYNNFITNLTKDSSIVLMNSLIDETKNHINDRIINYICKETDIDQDKNNLFVQDFDEVFQEGIDNYFDLGLFDNNNLKLKKLFSKDEFRQLKFILDRLREIRDEKDRINTSSNNSLDLTKDSNNEHLQQTLIENTKEEKKQFSTKYTHDELNKIFRKSMDKGLFKDDTKLEDFLYVFGGGIKPKNFNKLDWIITAKSKSVNKRLLIYYFMKIYNLKRDYVRSPFIQFINERVKAGDKIIELRSKADFEYIPEELKGIFPE